MWIAAGAEEFALIGVALSGDIAALRRLLLSRASAVPQGRELHAAIQWFEALGMGTPDETVQSVSVRPPHLPS